MVSIKSFEIAVLNGHEIEIEISIEIEEDSTDPEEDFDFGNARDNAECLERFHSGELFMGTISVRATAEGFEGLACLGACHLISAELQKGALETIADYGLKEEAIEELLGAISDAAEQLKKYTK